MSWSRRQAIGAIGALGGLAGCGFAPLYGTGGAGDALRGQVAVEVPDTVAGYRFADRIEERLGTPVAPSFVLAADIEIDRRPAALTAAGATTRFALPGRAEWRLADAAGATVASGSVDAFTGYSATGTTVATRAAEEDAVARLAVQLADLVVTRLAALEVV